MRDIWLTPRLFIIHLPFALHMSTEIGKILYIILYTVYMVIHLIERLLKKNDILASFAIIEPKN